MRPRRVCKRKFPDAVGRMDGVLDVERVRVRRAGKPAFCGCNSSVPRTASLEKVHTLTDAIEKSIGEIVPPT